MPGGWTASVYTPDQQSRLGVDENGHKLSESLASLNPFSGTVESVGPSYTLGKMEKPRGQRTVNGYTEAYYSEDQQRSIRRRSIRQKEANPDARACVHPQPNGSTKRCKDC